MSSEAIEPTKKLEASVERIPTEETASAIRACWSTLDQVRSYAKDHHPQAVPVLDEALVVLASAEATQVDTRFIQKIIDLSVACTNLFGLNQMARMDPAKGDYGPPMFHQRYARESGAGRIDFSRQNYRTPYEFSTYFTDPNEWASVAHALRQRIFAKQGECEIVESLEDARTLLAKRRVFENVTLIVVTRAVSAAEVNEIHNVLKADNVAFGENTYLQMHVRLGPELEASVLAGGKNEVFNMHRADQERNKDGDTVFRLSNPIPAQTLIRGLLSSGIAWPFDGNWSSPNGIPISEQRDEITISHIDSLLSQVSSVSSLRHERTFARKAQVFAEVPTEERKEKISRWLERHTQHYQKLFRSLKYGEPKVWFTRSGSSANDAVVRAIAKLLPENAPVYLDQSWYFENKEEVTYLFSEGKLSDARACFLSNSDVNGHEAQAVFNAQRDRVIAEFIENAARHPHEQFFLVLDTTFAPLHDPTVHVSLPNNVQLIRTTSWTKHQRGSRNQFFGSIAHTGLANIEKTMEAAVHDARGALSEDGVVHLPRVTAAEIVRNKEHIARLSRAFIEGFEKGQEKIDPLLRFSLVTNEFCIYIHSPLRAALQNGQQAYDAFAQRIGEAANIKKDDTIVTLTLLDTTTIVNRREILSMNGKYYSLAPTFLHSFPEATVGDSFGLLDTRITGLLVHINAKEGFGANPFGGLNEIRTPRVSPGLSATPETMRTFGREFVERLTKGYPDTFDAKFTPLTDEQIRSLDFSDETVRYRYGHYLRPHDAERVFLSGTLTADEQYMLFDRMREEVWDKDAFWRLSASPMSTFMLSQIGARVAETWTPEEIIKILSRKITSAVDDVIGWPFEKPLQESIQSSVFTKDQFDELLRAYNKHSSLNRFSLWRYLLQPALTTVVEPFDRNDFEYYAGEGLVDEYSVEALASASHRANPLDTAQVNLYIKQYPELEQFRNQLVRVATKKEN